MRTCPRFLLLICLAARLAVPPVTAALPPEEILDRAAQPSADRGDALEPKPTDEAFAKFNPIKAREVSGLWLRRGDRLAIIGDSITEQRMYSRIIESYLTACVPELEVAVRQYGWSGETAEGFWRRMTNDCLRFKPTIATTCYGMNDHRYQPYDRANAAWYLARQSAVLQSFHDAGARVVIGSPGCVGKMPSWVREARGTVEDLNLNLCAFRNIDLLLAQDRDDVRFADVFWPMFTLGVVAQKQFGADYAMAGKDGVHPDWAGQVVMATAFLKALGLNGDIGKISVDLAAGRAVGSPGHDIVKCQDGEISVTSRKYPFCAGGVLDKDNSIRSGMALVSFGERLNRFVLSVNNATGDRYRVTWGTASRSYSAAQLAQGINLAEEFVENPFSEAFKRVDDAVAAKQAYETRQIKVLFHGEEGRAEPELTAQLTEKVRQPLAEAVTASVRPVSHTLKIAAE